jgi:transcriptional regulator with XRE-family HTH domain
MAMSAREGVGYVPFPSIGPARLTSRLPKPEAPIPITVGDHVRLRRKVLGINQREAAKVIGVCRDALARWETGKTNPDVRMMPAVIRFLGYDPQPEARSFAELLTRTRRTLGLNQQGLSAALNVPIGTLSAWAQGLRCPPTPRMTQVIDCAWALVLARQDAAV